VTPPERQILGYALQSGTVPACVAAVPLGAWGPVAERFIGLLIELQAHSIAWDLESLIVLFDRAGYYRSWEQDWCWFTKSETLRFLRVHMGADEVAVLPQYAPWTLAEVEAACGLLMAGHVARLAHVAALEAAEARAEAVRVAAMARGCEALRRVWERLPPIMFRPPERTWEEAVRWQRVSREGGCRV
jgi:hypothetical protein